MEYNRSRCHSFVAFLPFKPPRWTRPRANRICFFSLRIRAAFHLWHSRLGQCVRVACGRPRERARVRASKSIRHQPLQQTASNPLNIPFMLHCSLSCGVWRLKFITFRCASLHHQRRRLTGEEEDAGARARTHARAGSRQRCSGDESADEVPSSASRGKRELKMSNATDERTTHIIPSFSSFARSRSFLLRPSVVFLLQHKYRVTLCCNMYSLYCALFSLLSV